VPEAPVHEDGEAAARQDDVRPAGQVGMDAEAEPRAVQRGAEEALRLGVP